MITKTCLLIIVVTLLLLCLTLCSAAWVHITSMHPVCFEEEVSKEDERVVLQYTKRVLRAPGDSYFSEDDVKLKVEFITPKTQTITHSKVLDKTSDIVSFPIVRVLKGEYTQEKFNQYTPEFGAYQICLSIDKSSAASGWFSSSSTAKRSPSSGLQVEVLIDHATTNRPVPIQSAKEGETPEFIRTRVDDEDGAKSKDEKSFKEVFSYTDSHGHLASSLRTHDFFTRIQSSIERSKAWIDKIEEAAYYFRQRQADMRVTSESIFTRTWAFSIAILGTLVGVSLLQLWSLRRFFKERKIS